MKKNIFWWRILHLPGFLLFDALSEGFLIAVCLRPTMILLEILGPPLLVKRNSADRIHYTLKYLSPSNLHFLLILTTFLISQDVFEQQKRSRNELKQQTVGNSFVICYWRLLTLIIVCRYWKFYRLRPLSEKYLSDQEILVWSYRIWLTKQKLQIVAAPGHLVPTRFRDRQ